MNCENAAFYCRECNISFGGNMLSYQQIGREIYVQCPVCGNQIKQEKGVRKNGKEQIGRQLEIWNNYQGFC